VAREFGSQGIRVDSIAPGLVEIDITLDVNGGMLIH